MKLIKSFVSTVQWLADSAASTHAVPRPFASAVLPGGDANPMNSLSYKLERLATDLKRRGNMDGAVTALRRAKAAGGDVDLRLVKYLQQANRYDEALAELDAFIAARGATEWARLSHRPEAERREAAARELGALYGTGALIARRQGDKGREVEFTLHAKRQGEINSTLAHTNELNRHRRLDILKRHKLNARRHQRLIRLFFPAASE